VEDATERREANLPSVALVGFMTLPICEALSKIDTDVAVLGVSYDAGIGSRPGTRFVRQLLRISAAASERLGRQLGVVGRSTGDQAGSRPQGDRRRRPKALQRVSLNSA
jgi:arginase family enzyme